MNSDQEWMRLACDLAAARPPSETAFSVGAAVVSEDGVEIARGHSRESDPHVHAEEAALKKAALAGLDVAGATMYSSLEPCARRASRPVPCAQLLIDAGIARVVTAWREPDLFVPGANGMGLLEAAGLAVTELPQFTGQAQQPNRI